MRALPLTFGLFLLLTVPSWAGEDLPPGIRAVDAKGALLPADQSPWPALRRRLAVVVHGINPVHADLDSLCRDLVQRDYAVLRFVYDDREALEESSRGLRHALATLKGRALPTQLAVVAHSMGGLVSRRALTSGDLTPPQQTRRKRTYAGRGRWKTRRVPVGPAPAPLPPLRGAITFLTVASPFGGFPSANWARLDFGLGRPVYRDLGTRSRFIRKPGQLGLNVTHVKVETDEKGHVRHDGASDHGVPRKSQKQKVVDADARKRLRLDLGHVGSIRDLKSEVPVELQAILTRFLGRRRGAAPAASGLIAPLRAGLTRSSQPR